MAKFGEKTFTFSEIQKFYTVPISSSAAQCFINVGKNSIVKVLDQKPIHTWTLTHPNYFTCPVVYCEENLYCVVNNKVLKKWSINEDNLKNAEKTKFQEPVFAVIPVSEKLPIIIFNSGKYAFTEVTDNHSINLSNSTCLAENEELLWADATSLGDTIVVCLVVYNEKNERHTACTFTVSYNETTEPELHRHHLIHQKATLKNWCLNKHNANFLSAWSDGSIFQHDIKEKKDFKILDIKSLNLDSSLAITSVDASHIIVATSSTKQKECLLEIYDTKFSVLKAQKVLKYQNIDSLQIKAENSTLFLYFNKEIISLPFEVEHSSLAAAVGKSISDTHQTNECTWDAQGLLQSLSKSQKYEPMDTTESTQEFEGSIEMIARRLLTQNSQLLMYLPESKLANLLQIAIKSHIQKSTKKCTKDAVSIILNIIFSASFNDIFLVKYLKRMNLEDALITLELLFAYLNNTIEVASVVVEKPSDLQIANWTCLVIQSHMESLLLSKDKKCKKLLRKLEKILNIKMEEYEDYEGVQNYFKILLKKDLLPEKCSIGKYSIETLDI